jgi:hypothetical protein
LVAKFVKPLALLGAARQARELNVDGIVEGTVQRSVDHVRITAQLIHAPSDKHRWGNVYERHTRDVFALERDLTQEIARGRIQAPRPGVVNYRYSAGGSQIRSHVRFPPLRLEIQRFAPPHRLAAITVSPRRDTTIGVDCRGTACRTHINSLGIPV